MTSPDVDEAVVHVVTGTEIRDVRLVRVDAEVNVVAAELSVEFRAGTARVNKNDDEITVTFEHIAEFTTPHGEPAARVMLGHAARFSYQEGLEVDEEILGQWIFGNVYFMVYPYIRESLQDTCLRLGLPAVVLGYLKRGQIAPETVSMLVTTTKYQHDGGSDQPLPLEPEHS